MGKYIAYEKLSKKEKRKVDSCRRKNWGSLSPVTRKPTNSKAYNRKKNQHWKDELHSADFSLLRPISLYRHKKEVPVCCYKTGTSINYWDSSVKL